MLKKTKNKIIIIFFIVGILTISAISIAYITMIGNANNLIAADGLDQNGKITEILSNLTHKTEMIVIVATITFIAVVIIISFIIVPK